MQFFAFGIIEVVMLVGLGGGAGIPLGIPPAPEDPLMAAVAPDECLFYTTWSGMADPDPNSPNHVEQLLAEPEVRDFFVELEKQIVTALKKAAEREGPETIQAIDDGAKWVKKLLTSPTAIYLSSVKMGPEGPDVQGAAIVNVGEEAVQLKALMQKYQAALLGPALKSVQIDGDTYYQIKPAPDAPLFTWGLKKRYFVVGIGEGAVEALLANARTPVPAWLTDLREKLPVERVSTVSYINVKGLVETFGPMGGPEVTQVIDALGLSNVTSVASITGLDEKGFISRNLLAIDGEPQGLLTMLPDKPLTAADLAAIPADATIAMALRLDPDEVFEAILSTIGKIEPRANDEMIREMNQMEAALGFSIRNDLLQAVGDTWCIYNSPSQGGLIFTGLTGVVKIKDRARLEKVQAVLIKLMDAEANQGRRMNGRYYPQPKIEKFEFAGRDVYMLNVRDDDFPLAPTWCLTDDELIVAPYPQNIKAYLSRDTAGKTLADVPEVAKLFDATGGPIMLTYADTPKLFEMVYPIVPIIAQAALSQLAREEIDISVSLLPSAPAIGKHLRPGVTTVRRTAAGIEMTSRQSLPGGSVGASVPVMAALLVPAVFSAREAAVRAQSANNLKQISLGMLNHESAKKKFPAAFSVDKNGKALLSWRVQILPYLGEKALYEEFHLDEPWDSDHNKKLIAEMPHVYRSPTSKAGEGKTNYLTVRGKDTLFPGKEAMGIKDAKDGASQTIMTVEVTDEKAVTWTKPDDFTPDAKDPMKGLISPGKDVFQVGFADGSVRTFHRSTDASTLKAMFSRAGEEGEDGDADHAHDETAHDHAHE